MAQKLSAVQEMELLRFGERNKSFIILRQISIFLGKIFLIIFAKLVFYI
jgi:hypothetical protein